MNTKNHLRIKGMSPQFVVEDIRRSLEFYSNNLGFEISFYDEGFYAGITKDGYSIHLKSGHPAIEERQNKKNNEHLDILFSIEEIEDLYKDITTRPVDVTQPLREMPYGREFYITDPDGYIIAFLEEK